VSNLKTKLTLQEKLRDLREEKKLRLADVSEATGIPATTLQRFESDENSRIGYQDVEVLTRFYKVSADYLFGLTDNRKYRDFEMDRLNLSDKAIEVLASRNLNNKLLSEVIAHSDFAELLAGLEVFLDGNLSENMGIVNMSYKLAIDTINKQTVTVGRDEYIATLKEASIDPDDYLRYRLSQRFDKLAKSLYGEHKKESQSEVNNGYINTLGEQVQKYQDVKDETNSAEQAKLAILADQLGVDLKKTSKDEKQSMLGFLSRSRFVKFIKRRK